MLTMVRQVIYVSILIFALYIGIKAKIYYSRYWPVVIRISNIHLTSPDSIVYQSDTTLTPVYYKGTIDFREVSDENRKNLFIMYILPAIVITRERLMDDLRHVEFIEERISREKSISTYDSTFLAAIKIKYETDSLNELRKRIYPHPVSLALTQAVLESGWGTSNIFRNGNNAFGVMSFSSEDTRSVIQYSDGDDEQYARTYSSMIESVEHYFLLISTVGSYKRFRQKRWEGRASTKLLEYLRRYHDGSDHYAEMALSIIASNNLEKYDNIRIDPKYKEKYSLRSFLMKY